CRTGTLAAGLVLLIVGSIGLVAYDPVLRWQVLQHIALRNGTMAYSQFISPKVPVRIQFYAFDLQNPIEVINGDRPFVVQRGPFTYAEVRRKEDVSYDELRDWLTYKQNRTYLFLRNESVADDSWRFTTANLPLVTILNSLRFMPQALQRFASAALAAFPNETLFPRLSVRDVAFGYHDKLLRLAHEVIPGMVYTDFIGVLAGLNNTYDGVYTISAGLRDPQHLGEIQAFNGSRSLHFWSSELANLVIGSDGSLAPPFLNKSALLPAFISDICRSLYGVFDSEVDAAGGLLRLWRFTGPDRLLANASENPDNAGYCTPAGNCLPAGLFNLTECKRLDGLHIPVVASLPHFLLAAPEIQASVRGLYPDDRAHRTYVDIEPLSGAVLQLYKRLQINLQLDAGPAYAAFAPNLRSQFYPMLWINESAVVDVDTASQLRDLLLTPQLVAKIAIGVAMGLGSLVTTVATFLLLLQRRRNAKTTQADSSPTSGAVENVVNGVGVSVGGDGSVNCAVTEAGSEVQDSDAAVRDVGEGDRTGLLAQEEPVATA
ncbi:hypothetical protein BOX15_Mlig025401g1, partial [Macrostomum lignano]